MPSLCSAPDSIHTLPNKPKKPAPYLITETQVTDFIFDDGKVVGVRTGREGDLYADVVLDAEGINAFAAVKAGLRKDYTMENAALAVKEIHALPAETINQRFNVGDEPGGDDPADRGVPARHDGERLHLHQ